MSYSNEWTRFIRSLLLFFWLPSAWAAVISTDTFTEGSDTPLENHTSDTGDMWVGGVPTNYTVLGATDDIQQEGANIFNCTSVNANPTETDYWAEVTGVINDNAEGTDRIGVSVRMENAGWGTIDAYYMEVRFEDGIRVFRRINGVSTSLGAPLGDLNWIANNSVQATDTLRIRLQVEGTGAAVTLTTFTEINGGGLNMEATDTDTHMDRIVVAGNPGACIGDQEARITLFHSEDLVGGGTIPIIYNNMLED